MITGTFFLLFLTLRVSKSVGDGFSVGARGSLNRISKLGDVSADDLSHYAVDGTNQISNLKNTKLDPFLKSAVVTLGLMKSEQVQLTVV